MSSSLIKRKCIPQLGSCVGECSFPISFLNSFGFQNWSFMIRFEIEFQVLLALFMQWHKHEKEDFVNISGLHTQPIRCLQIIRRRSLLFRSHKKSCSCILHLLLLAISYTFLHSSTEYAVYYPAGNDRMKGIYACVRDRMQRTLSVSVFFSKKYRT